MNTYKHVHTFIKHPNRNSPNPGRIVNLGEALSEAIMRAKFPVFQSVADRVNEVRMRQAVRHASALNLIGA